VAAIIRGSATALKLLKLGTISVSYQDQLLFLVVKLERPDLARNKSELIQQQTLGCILVRSGAPGTWTSYKVE